MKHNLDGRITFGNYEKEDRTFETKQGRGLIFSVYDNESRQFLNCKTFNTELVERIENQKFIEVEDFRIINESWEDKNTGHKRYSFVIIINKAQVHNNLSYKKDPNYGENRVGVAKKLNEDPDDKRGNYSQGKKINLEEVFK